jgi:uncharacterized protein (UPF0548 family)
VFVLGQPTVGDLERVLWEQASERVTYAAVRATQGRLPEGYRHDRHVVELGAGEDVYERSVQGLVDWEAHRRAGVTVHPAKPPILEGETVVLAVALPGISAIAACRIVYVTDEANRFGFAYGTLPAHPEEGEEAFHVEADAHGTVRLVVTAFSRPRHPLARIGSPLARQVQLRVTRRYLTSLASFVAGR